MSWITGRCNTCGYIFDVTNSLDCPACRAARVAAAFRPVDSLRTALGIAGKRPKDSQEWSSRDELGAWYDKTQEAESEDTPRDCKMPQDESEQVYQLRRWFRL
jgi:hypothetical protein